MQKHVCDSYYIIERPLFDMSVLVDFFMASSKGKENHGKVRESLFDKLNESCVDDVKSQDI